MIFTSPIWLTLVVPWAGLVVWILWGRSQKLEVSFLKLWPKQPAQRQTTDRAWNKPPFALAALLAAIFLGILAAAGPAISASSKPAGETPDIKIESLAIRTTPKTQAMVRLLNRTDLRQAALSIRADNQVVHFGEVALPAIDQTQDYFVDVPASPKTIEATIDFNGTQRRREAIRQASWPIIEPRGSMPPELKRMIAVYTHDRPPGDSSRHITIRRFSDSRGGDQPAALLMDDSAQQQALTGSPAPLIIADSPLSQSVGWTDILTQAHIAGPPTGAWQSIVTVGLTPVVAIQQEPIRQVWIGFNSDQFPHRADFVIFWTAVFDWLGAGEPTYDSPAPPADLRKDTLNTINPPKSLVGETVCAALVLICLSALKWKPTLFTHSSPVNS